MSGRAARAAKQRKRALLSSEQALKDAMWKYVWASVQRTIEQNAYIMLPPPFYLADWEPRYIDTTYTFESHES